MKRQLLPLLALAALLSACGSDDNGVGPDGPDGDCDVGTIDVGGTRDFTLGENFGCDVLQVIHGPEAGPIADDIVHAASYRVELQAGTAYSILAVDRSAEPSSNFDLTMALYGPGDDTTDAGWIAASDDEGFGPNELNPQIIIVPRVSGTYSIRVAGVSAIDEGDVRLTVRTCTRGATLPADGTVAGTINVNACTFDPGLINIHQFQATQGEFRVIMLQSDAFVPALYIGGPGQDIWNFGGFGNSFAYAADEDGDGFVEVEFEAERTGTYTLLAWSVSGETGSYDLASTTGFLAARAQRDAPAAATGRRKGSIVPR